MSPNSFKSRGTITSFDAFKVAKPLSRAASIKAKTVSDLRSTTTALRNSSSTNANSDNKKDRRSEKSESLDTPPTVLRSATSDRPLLAENDLCYLEAAKIIRQAKRTPNLHTKPNPIDIILRDFDLTGKYGPCVGITRLDRFKRAKRMKMNPPEVVGQILETQQAHTKLEYKHEVKMIHCLRLYADGG